MVMSDWTFIQPFATATGSYSITQNKLRTKLMAPYTNKRRVTSVLSAHNAQCNESYYMEF
jgi:hypothetical protein